MNDRYTNKLIHENSPYLLQHAHNPVNWYPWGDEAFQKAKDENKLMLVSIGYAACHWCHVMERESFENEATAKIMNDHFVNIKIDREERPDIDHVYMDAVQAMSGSGGWPLNVFLTPEAKPFYGGTYFPPAKAFNRPSWTEVLLQITEAWRNRSNEIIAQAENLTDHLSKSGNNFINKIELDNSSFQFDQCEKMFASIMKSADAVWGGFGAAPKFPQTATIKYLLQYYHYSKNEQALKQALLSIDKMLQGGIYDHVAGGLSRYSTDTQWLAPHFEKMLYDNALLIDVMCDVYQITKLETYKTALEKTINFIITEMKEVSGGFYAAYDADSEGEEGKYYVWEKSEIEKILDAKDATLFCDYFDVSKTGNWEGKNILRILKPANEFAEKIGIEKEMLEMLLDNGLQKLKAEREKRIAPALDDKIILSWNALMIKAIAKAAIVLKNDQYASIAMNAFNFIEANFKNVNSKSLQHTWKAGIAKHPAFLDDYAYLIDSCLELYSLTFDTNYLHKANAYCNQVVENYSDEENLFFYFTAKGQQDIIVRKKDIYDGATPSANAVMANNLFRLSIIFENSFWQQRANTMLLQISTTLVKYPTSFAYWANIFINQIMGINEITLVGIRSREYAATIQSELLIATTLITISDGDSDELPIWKNKQSGSESKIYLCRKNNCKPPIKALSELMDIIRKEDIIANA